MYLKLFGFWGFMPAPSPSGQQAVGQQAPRASPSGKTGAPKELIDTSKADRHGLGVAQPKASPGPGPIPRRNSSLGKENPAAKIKDAAARKPDDVQKWYDV